MASAFVFPSQQQKKSHVLNQYIENIVHAFALLADDHSQLQRIQTLAAELDWAGEDEVQALLTQLTALAPAVAPEILDRGLETVIQRLGPRSDGSAAAPPLPPGCEPLVGNHLLGEIETLYRAVLAESRSRNHLLNWLARIQTTESLETFVGLVVDDPPTCETSVVLAFAPLLQNVDAAVPDVLFPELLAAVQHRSVAAIVIDLANYYFRSGTVKVHPAGDHVETMTNMLGMLAEQLAMIEEGRLPDGLTPVEVSRIVNDTVSLITALCDGLALLGASDARGQLTKAASLKHRRIRTEALSALARLGEEEAGSELLKMAEEPVARLRVLAYAEEMGLTDKVAPEYRTAEAIAESEMAVWLASPENMGLAPNHAAVVDSRTLAWPGFDDVVPCFLVHYVYELASQRIENLGIVGPVTHAFSLDLSKLPFSEIYAAFAGWSAVHDEIEELTLEQAEARFPGLQQRLLSRLSSEALSGLPLADVTPVFVGMLMGEPALVAEGIRFDRHGTIVVTRDEVAWFDPGGGTAPGRNELAWAVFKGRRMLAAFNDPQSWPGALAETTLASTTGNGPASSD